MAIEALVRANAALGRHRRLLAAIAWTAFAIVCADYAGFIRLPDIVTVPTMAAGILTGLRYMLWEGWLKQRLEVEPEPAAAGGAGEAPGRGSPPAQS